MELPEEQHDNVLAVFDDEDAKRLFPSFLYPHISI